VIKHDDRLQVISPAARGTYSYDLETGKELWRIQHASHSSGARTIFSDNLAITFSGINPTESAAIRLDGKGDVTATHIAWTNRRGVPSRSSPILLGDRLYMATEQGVLTCFDIGLQKTIWQERLGSSFTASLVHAADRIYLFDEAGTTHVVRPGDTFQRLATNKLTGGLMASPAIAGQAIYLRTRTHLYRVENE